ncbi:MAG: hypothetical protein LBP92_13745 [Deltaproteobacteria bacterium]|nr:hypothetical protein [Deltaproteobacteria bacterium]
MPHARDLLARGLPPGRDGQASVGLGESPHGRGSISGPGLAGGVATTWGEAAKAPGMV